MAAPLPPPPGARIAVVALVVALHGAAFFPWAGAPEPAATDAIDVAIVPLGDSALDAQAAAAAPPAAEETPAVNQPSAVEPSPVVADPPPQPAEEASVAEVLPKPPEPSPVTLPDQAKQAPAQEKTKPEQSRVAPKVRSAKARSVRSDDGRSARSSAESRRGDANGEAGATGSARANYAGLVVAEFNRHKRYPETARRNREQGAASVAFSIDAAGRVAAYTITRSSGKAALDRAVDAMMSAARLPPPPGGSFRGTFVANFTLDH
jgi:periplasmic protein TonB